MIERVVLLVVSVVLAAVSGGVTRAAIDAYRVKRKINGD